MRTLRIYSLNNFHISSPLNQLRLLKFVGGHFPCVSFTKLSLIQENAISFLSLQTSLSFSFMHVCVCEVALMFLGISKLFTT